MAKTPNTPVEQPAVEQSSVPSPVPTGPRRITATLSGFRRAGRAWPGPPGVTVEPDQLTLEQWAAILAEPRLIVAEVD